MKNQTTLRVAAAKRQLNKGEIGKLAGLNIRTVDKLYDGIPDDVNVRSLRQIAEAMGLKLVVSFIEPTGGGNSNA